MMTIGGLLILAWLIAMPIMAGLWAGVPGRGGLAVVAVLMVAGPALFLTAVYGWPFDECMTDGGCWEGLIMIPFYVATGLAAVFYFAALWARRRSLRGKAERFK